MHAACSNMQVAGVKVSVTLNAPLHGEHVVHVHVLCCAGLREGPPSSHYDRVFDNEMNIAVFNAKVSRS